MPVHTQKHLIGFQHGGRTFGDSGYQMADFVAIKRPGSDVWEQGEDGVLDRFATVDVEAVRDGKTLKYSRKVSLSDFDSDPNKVIEGIAPRGAHWDNTGNQLKRIVELGADAEFFPKFENEYLRSEDGEYQLTTRLCTRPVQIVGEFKANNGETMYRLLSGNTRVEVSLENLIAGNFGFPGAQFSVLDKIGLAMRLKQEWAAQSPGQRLQFAKDEHLEEVRKLNEKIAALGS